MSDSVKFVNAWLTVSIPNVLGLDSEISRVCVTGSDL